jgi:WXG100 family type VII secretion target
MSSKIVYNYDEMSSVDKVCRDLIEHTNGSVQDLKKQMESLVGEGWTGQTATDYQAKIEELVGKLQEYNDTLQRVDNQFTRNTQDMQDVDSRGSKKVNAI